MEAYYISLVVAGLISELTTILLLSKQGFIWLPKIWKPLLFLTIAGFLTDFISLILLFISFYNYWFLYLYSLLEILCFFFIFRNLLENRKLKKTLFLITIFQILVLFAEFILTGPNELNFISNVLNKLVIITFSSFLSYKEFNNALTVSSKKYFNVLVIIVFYSLSIFYFSLFEKFIKSDSSVYNFLWPIPMLSTILLNFFISITIWKKKN